MVVVVGVVVTGGGGNSTCTGDAITNGVSCRVGNETRGDTHAQAGGIY